jgi:alpha-1,6-mannosyltransferase
VIYNTGRRLFCKPLIWIYLLPLAWLGLVAGLWPVPEWRPYRELANLTLLVGWIALWLWQLRYQPLTPRQLVLPIGLLWLVSLWLPPFQSTDVLGYVNRGWQQWHYHTNPYVTTIAQLPNWQHDAMLTDHWIDNPCPYGVVFARLAHLTCAMGTWLQWDKAGMVALFKATQLGLLVFALRFAANRPTYGHAALAGPMLPVAQLAWHPIVVVHGLTNGHNDGWVATLMLVGYALCTRGWAVILLPTVVVLGGLIKLVPVIALPITLTSLWRLAGPTKTLAGICIAVLVAVMAIVPYWDPHIQWAALTENVGLSHNSLHALLLDLYQALCRVIPGLPADTLISSLIKGGLWGLAGFGWVWFTLQPLRAKQWSWPDWLTGLIAVQCLLLLVASSKFHGWYLNMIVPLLWLVPMRPWLWAVLGISLAYSLGISFLGRSHIANTLIMTILPCLLAYRVWAQQAKRSKQP